ncbi:unnamed protein product [Brassica oleracea var. botrytis]
MAAKQILDKGITRTIGTGAETKMKEPSTNALKTEVWKDTSAYSSNASIVPWLVWYIWNRNDKCFNNELRGTGSTKRQQRHVFQHTAGSDASWSESDNGAGLGFILLDGDADVITGMRKRGQAKSPIHAEVESLLWAMEEVSGRGFQQVSFESEKLFFFDIHSKSYLPPQKIFFFEYKSIDTILAGNLDLQFWPKISIYGFGGKSRFYGFGGKSRFYGFGGKSRFYGFDGKTRFYGFSGKIRFYGFDRKLDLRFWRKILILRF